MLGHVLNPYFPKNLAFEWLHIVRIGIIGFKGRIAVGYDADFTIVDMKRRETIRDSWIASRCGWTPHDGREVTGWPVGTIVRGRRVMWQGELVEKAQGEAVRFHAAL